MNTIVIIRSDGSRTEHQPDSDLSLVVNPGDEVVLLDENGEPAEAELKRNGEDLEVIFDDGTTASLEDFYTSAGDNDPITIALAAQNSVEEYAEFEGRVGNLPGSGNFSLMRFSNTGYIEFDNSLGQFGEEISGLANADNTPGPEGSENGGNEIVPELSEPLASEPASAPAPRRGPTIINNFAEPAPAVSSPTVVNGDPYSTNTLHQLDEDGVARVSGTIPVLDPNGDLVTVSIGEGTQYGDFSVNAVGNYSYTPDHSNPTIQQLNVGDTLVDYATIRVRDPHGNEALSVVRFNITGTNDAPIAEPAFGTVAEPGSDVDVAFATGQVHGTDVDTGARLSFQGTSAPTYGTIKMDADGNWTYLVDPGNATVQALNIGETLTETIDYEVVDEHGAKSTSTITISILGTNDAPVAQVETATIAEDAVTVGGTLDATDIDSGAVLTFTPVTDAPGDNNLGNFTIAADGAWSFDLDNGNTDVQALAVGESLVETYTYTVTDEHGATSTETISVTITGTNDDPVATDDSASIEENGAAITILVLPNDSDIDGDPLTVDSVDDSALTGGSATLVGNEIIFDPGSDFDYLSEGETAIETVAYTITDGNGGTDAATVTITVTGTNDGPSAVNDLGTVDEDAAVNLDLLDNDTDPDTSDKLTITAINGVTTAGVMTLPSGATVTIMANGTVDYDPGDAFDHLDDTESTKDSFTYTISDGNGGAATATATVTITGGDDPTVTQPDTATTNEGNVVAIDVLGNDSDPDTSDNPLTVDTVTQPPVGQGSVTIAPDNSFVSFDPGTDFNDLAVGETETVTFTYTTSTGANERVTVTVTGENDGPTAVADVGTVDEDATVNLDLLHNDTDPDTSDKLTITAVNGITAAGVMTLPSGATVTILANGTVDYDPGDVFDYLDDGESAADSFTYTISDGNGGTDTATATVTITGGDDPTVTQPDSATTNENTAVTIDVLGNDSDPDTNDNPLTVASVNTTGLAGGSVTNNGTNVTFDPGTDFDGLADGETEDVTFTYTTNTGATETVTVTVTGTNDGPVAVNDIGAVDEDATLAVNATGGVVQDNDTDLDTTDVLTVTGVRTGAEAGTGTIGIVGNGLTGTYGTLTLAEDGSYTYVADQPAANALADTVTATDVFTYTVSDGNGGSDTAEITITVTGVNDGPVAVDDAGAVDEEATLIVVKADGLVDSNDTDVDGDTLTITAGDGITLGAYGTLTLATDGSYSYIANTAAANALAVGETATDTFSYTIDDGNGGTDTADLVITVTGTNDGPMAVDDTATTDEDSAVLNIDLLGDDSDPDGDTLSLIEIDGVAAGGTITLASGALVTVHGDGTVDYDPNGQFNHLDDTQSTTDSFTYTISDGNGGTDTATATVTITGGDDPTVTQPDSATTNENTAVTIDVLGNDSDPDTNDNPLTVASVNTTGLAGGSVTNNGTNVTFDPGTDFDGLADGETEDVTFTYTTNTGATETVTVTVTGTNDGPVAVNDIGAVDEDATLAVNATGGVVQDNDTDLDTTDVLTVTGVRTGAEAGTGTIGIVGNGLTGTYGTLTLAEDGSYTYVADQPAANALADTVTATDVFTYTVSDGNGGSDTAEITITVTGVNDGPVAVDDAGAVDEEATLIVVKADGLVDSNDTDVDGDTLTITAGDGITLGAYGTLTLATDGSYSYIANTAAANALAVGETATDTFSYTIDDGNGGTDTADLVITVTGTNDGPMAVDDTATTDEDSAVLNIDLLGDDSDPDGDTLSLIEIDGVAAGGTITLASGALVTVHGDGTVDYDPNGQFNHLDDTQSTTDSFTYTISDGNGGTDTATATVTITGGDDPTVTQPDSATTNENTAVTIDVLGNDSDPDTNDNPLTVASVNTTGLAGGSVTNNGTNVTFDPGTDFDGLADGETEDVTFTYTTNTGATETVTVTVTGTNDGPVAVNDIGAVDEDATLAVNATGGVVQDNDTDLDTTDVLTVTGVRTGAEAGTGTIGIVGNGLTGTYGTLTLAEDGSYTYVADQPAANALADTVTATDVFTYTVSDGNGGSDTAEITITVTGVNDGPVAVDDAGAVDEEATLIVVKADGLVDSNDTDVDGDTLTITAGDGITLGAYGTLTLATDGSYSYIANTAAANALAVGETATDTFSYTIDDGNGGTDTADLVITVTGTNDGPMAVDDTATTDEDSAVLNIDLLGDDSDPDGDTLSLIEIDGVAAGGTITLASGALVTVHGDGTVDYDPNGQFNHLDDTQSTTDSFTYTISDGNGGTDTATATVTITGGDDPTVTQPDSATTNENTAVTIDVLGNDSDPDTNDNPLTVASVNTTGLAGGSVTNNGTNVTFDPGTDFDGLADGETEDVTFTYTTNTGATETVTVTVTGTNDGPVAVNDIGAVDEDATLAVNATGGVVQDNDTDLDTTDVLTVTGVRTGAEAGTGTIGIVGNGLTGTYGTLTLAEDGSYTYVADQPAANALADTVTATDVFTYTVSDGNGGSDTAEITITVTGVNDGPVAVDDAGAVDEEATLIVVKADGLVDSNDTDVDGDTLTITAGDGITLGAYGTLTLATDGSYSYIANTAAANALAVGETATDTFSYTIDDGNGGTDTADLVITVTGTNDGPMAVDDTATTDEDSAVLNIDLLGDDSDPDGDTLSLIEIDGVAAGGTITLASGALVTVHGDGTVDYDPNGQFNHLDDTQSTTDSFTYTISDGNGGTDTATATVTITGGDDPTVTQPDSATTNENTAVTIDVLGNDSDPDTNDNPLTVASVNTTGLAGGSVTNNGTNVTFDPGTDFDGLADGETEDVTFTYTTNTGATETVTVTVTGTNDGPVAVNDIGAVDEDATLAVNATGGVVQDNDTDLDTTDVLTVTGVRTGAEAGTGTIGIVGNGLTGTYGTLTLAEDGSYTYVADQPAANALADTVTATDVFTYTVSDGNGGSDTAEITITVTGVNDGPVAVDDAGAVDEEATLIVVKADGLVDSNDTDVDGDTLTITAGDGITLGAYGTLTLATDGSYSYIANTAAANALAVGETATDTFSYFISDSNGGVDTADLVITVTGSNDGPIAVNDAGAVDEGATITVATVNGVIDDNDTDLDSSDTLTVTSVRTGSEAGSGTFGIIGNGLTGTYGTLYLAEDGSYSYDADLPAADALADSITATDTFTYTISDGNGGTDSAELIITVTGTNDGPVAVDDTGAVVEDATLSVVAANGVVDSNDTDLDGDTLTVTDARTEIGTYGTLTLAADGGYDYTADQAAADALAAGETSTDSFSYTISDGNGGTDTATLTITVTGSNDGPIAVNDAGAIDEDATITVATVNGVINDNDTDLDSSDTLTVTSVRTGPEAGSGTIGIVGNDLEGTYGTLTLQANGGYTYVADQPAADGLANGASATDIFTYAISDGNGGTDIAEIIITVTGTDDAPVAVDDTGVVDENDTLTVGKIAGLIDSNDSDPDGDTLTITDARTEVGNFGTLTLASDGSYTYAADQAAANMLAKGETATDNFSYTISDGNGESDTATLTITITGINDDPTAVDNVFSVNENEIFTATLANSVVNNDSDPDGDTLSVNTIPISNVSNGSLVLSADGTFIYTPNTGFQGTDSFVYEVSDGNGGTDTATATIIIDNDGDRYANNVDLDDDNDGILDTDECVNTKVSVNVLEVPDHLSMSDVPLLFDGDKSYTGNTDLEFHDSSPPLSGDNVLIFELSRALESGTEFTLYFENDDANGQEAKKIADNLNAAGYDETYFDRNNDGALTGADFDVNGDGDVTSGSGDYSPLGFTIYYYLGDPGYPAGSGAGTLVHMESSPLALLDSNVHSHTVAAPSSFDHIVIESNADGTGKEPRLIEIEMNGNANSGALEFGEIDCDTDGDGIENRLELDADNGGIYDLTEVEPSLDSNGDGMVDGPVDINGVPVAAGGGIDPTSGLTNPYDGADDLKPDAVDDNGGRITSDTTTTINLLGNDSDPNGDPLTITHVDGTLAGGTFAISSGALVTVNANGTIYYETNGAFNYLDPGETATDTFSYTISDGNGETDTATVTVTIDGLVELKADLWIGNDQSGSVNNSGEFAATRNLIAGAAEMLAFEGDLDAQTALFSWGATGEQTFDYALTNDKDAFTTFVEDDSGSGYNRTYNGGTEIAEAITYGASLIQNQANGGRVGVNQILLLITDADASQISGSQAAITSAAQAAKNSGIIVAFIGVDQASTNSTARGILENAASEDTFGNDLFFGFNTYASITPSTIVDLVKTFANVPPIVIDLDGDGVEFDSIDDGIELDVDNDGELEQTAWANEDDGVLIYDANDNNDVDGNEEYAFAQYAGERGATDLEGLRSFDSDGDGLLTAGDEEFDHFKVWQDRDGSGTVGDGELVALEGHGIESIGLISDGQRSSTAGGDVTIEGYVEVGYTDGTTGQAADASFSFDNIDPSELIEDENADADLEVVANDGSTVDLDQPAPTTAGGHESAAEPAAVAAPAPAPAPAEPVTPPPAAPASLDDDAAAAAATGTV